MARVSASELAKWLNERADGDPPDALAALAVVTAEYLKLAPVPTRTLQTYVKFLERATQLPSSLLEVMPDTTAAIFRTGTPQ